VLFLQLMTAESHALQRGRAGYDMLQPTLTGLIISCGPHRLSAAISHTASSGVSVTFGVLCCFAWASSDAPAFFCPACACQLLGQVAHLPSTYDTLQSGFSLTTSLVCT
jgi:hypothetical protein